MTVTATPLAATPPPAGRGRWRTTLYTRQFSSGQPSPIADLGDARGQRLDRKRNSPAQYTFTLDGHSPSAALVVELATDVIVWRWDDMLGRDVVMFRGLVDHSEDQITEQSATVTFTAHDYLAQMARRILTTTRTYTATDQDDIAYDLFYQAVVIFSSSGTGFYPGSFLPLDLQPINPNGTARSAPSGQARDRTYQAQSVVGQVFDDLANVIGGFEYDLEYRAPTQLDKIRVFYPRQGVTRTDVALIYGVNVSTVTRTVSSGDYANYVRVLGNKGSAAPATAQVYAEAWNADANNVSVNPVGLWMMAENASDVTVTATLQQKADGDLAYHGLLVPTYTLGLRPGVWSDGLVNMGDTVPLYIKEGRLNVSTTIRVVGMSWSVGENDDETVTLTVGRPESALYDLIAAPGRDIDALTRR